MTTRASARSSSRSASRSTELARARNVAGLEELLESLAAEGRDHLGVGNAAHASELLEAEQARAVADQRRPVDLTHHAPLLGAETRLLERRLRVLLEQLALLRLRQPVEEAIEAQRPAAPLQREEIRSFELLDSCQLRVCLL